jgi:hypothetical protein
MFSQSCPQTSGKLVRGATGRTDRAVEWNALRRPHAGRDDKAAIAAKIVDVTVSAEQGSSRLRRLAGGAFRWREGRLQDDGRHAVHHSRSDELIFAHDTFVPVNLAFDPVLKHACGFRQQPHDLEPALCGPQLLSIGRKTDGLPDGKLMCCHFKSPVCPPRHRHAMWGALRGRTQREGGCRRVLPTVRSRVRHRASEFMTVGVVVSVANCWTAAACQRL